MSRPAGRLVETQRVVRPAQRIPQMPGVRTPISTGPAPVDPLSVGVDAGVSVRNGGRATSQTGREGDRSWLDQRRADVEFDDLVCGERNAAWVDVVTLSVEENRYWRPGGTDAVATERLLPDVEEVPEGVDLHRRRLDVDDSVRGVGV